MTPYPKKKDTPSRKNRKGSRRTVFLKNKAERALKKRAKRDRNRAIAAEREAAAERAEAELQAAEEAANTAAFEADPDNAGA